MQGDGHLLAAALASCLLLAAIPSSAVKPSDHVNTFIGTLNGGHVFAGATLPFGAVKAGADSDSTDNQGGYVSDGSGIRGISQLHDDGTGGGASLGNFKLLPLDCLVVDGTAGDNGNCVVAERARTVPQIPGSAQSLPGYFSIGLEPSFTAEVTVTAHAALHRFTFPSDAQSPTLLLDLTNDLSHSFRGTGSLDLQRQGGETRVKGSGQVLPSFGEGSYEVYFCLDVNGVAGTATYIGNDISTARTSLTGTVSARLNDEAGALLSFDRDSLPDSQVLARIGISWSSAEAACAYAESEIPTFASASDFDSVKAAAQKTWDDYLGVVQVSEDGVAESVLEVFWSSLYRTLISPYNITGDNPLWTSSEPFYDSFYCIWDSYRVVHPLLTIVAPRAQAEILRAVIDIYRNTGFLPDCRMSLDKGFTQGGSNADNLLADSYVKGFTSPDPAHPIDWETAYEGMKKDAEVSPPNWGLEGRGGIQARKELGYVPVDDTSDPAGTGTKGRSASRTLEYAYNDFGIALVAKGLGKREDFDHYSKASDDWKNLWNPDTTDSGFSGFIQPRYKDGTFQNADPRRCSPAYQFGTCYLNDQGGEFYEASAHQYSFFVPHDMASLVPLMGGKDTFSARLDALWANRYGDIGDEPGFLPNWLWHYVGQPSKTADRIRQLIPQFNTSVNGIPGNDDSGATAAFAVFNLLGFYPVAGQSVYLLSVPFFSNITFSTGPRSSTQIISTNFDASTPQYIQSATLNGKPFTRNWISHQQLFPAGDAVLEFELGPQPGSWGTADEDLPPSKSTGGKFAEY